MQRRALATVWLALIMLLTSFSSAQVPGQPFDVAADDGVIRDGIAWYLSSRQASQEFEQTFKVPGYRHYATCFFGCMARWSWPSLIVSRWGDGVGRPEVLRSVNRRQWPALDRRPPAPADTRVLRAAALLASLERELGWPTLQAALAAGRASGRPLVEVLESATARPLSAAFAMALQSQPVDYAVAGVTSANDTCGDSPCVVTRVRLQRTADVPFPLELRVDFESGSPLTTYWDGKEDEMTFESASAPSRAVLDPHRVWLLDHDYGNGEYIRARATNVPILKWVAHWTVWLQDAMLTFSFPA